MLLLDNDVSLTDELGCSPCVSSPWSPHRQTFQPTQDQALHCIDAEDLQPDSIPLEGCTFWWDGVFGRRSSCMNSRFPRRLIRG